MLRDLLHLDRIDSKVSCLQCYAQRSDAVAEVRACNNARNKRFSGCNSRVIVREIPLPLYLGDALF